MSCAICGADHPERVQTQGPGLLVLKEYKAMAEDFAVTETLYLDADKTRVLKEGDPQAAWLLAVPGDHIPAAEAQRLGLTGKAAAPAEEKAVHGSANKALSPQQDK